MSVYITRKWNRYCNTVSRTHNSNVPGQIVHMQGGRAATRARMTSNRRTDYLVFSMVKRHGFIKKNRKNLVMGRLRSGNPCGGERPFGAPRGHSRTWRTLNGFLKAVSICARGTVSPTTTGPRSWWPLTPTSTMRTVHTFYIKLIFNSY